MKLHNQTLNIYAQKLDEHYFISSHKKIKILTFKIRKKNL